jgi:sulfite reductase (NADPH) hemoprotein beta-component
MSSAVETIKKTSARLRGELLASLVDPVTGALHESDQTIIKYHGSYQQDNRDEREQRRVAKLEPAYSFMIRTRTPGGVISLQQWLKLDEIASRFAERGLRITSRQAIQFHGVIKRQLKATMAAINASLIDTLAACGDVNRNIAVAVNPRQSSVHARVYADAAALSERLLPNSRAYYEIWLDEERVAGSGEENDPIYGESYLPRKFKIGFVVPPVNDVDVYTQDLGFIADVQDGEVVGYQVTVGGGMGASHNDPETFPRLADTLGQIAPEHVQAVAIAVLTTQRDFGNREVRKRARLKYTIEDRGLVWFKAEVEARSGVNFTSAKTVEFHHSGDQFGWMRADHDEWSLGLRIVAGRIDDVADRQIRLGLRRLAEHLLNAGAEAQFRLTPNQNLLIAGVPNFQRDSVNDIATQFGLTEHNNAQSVLLHAMACVALPTCGLAMAEAERYLPEFARKLQALWHRCGLAQTPLQLRISGCPNGCSRPYACELALVGKAPGRYNVFIGGSHVGTRLNQLYKENLSEPDILQTLETLFIDYARQRTEAERFGDYCARAVIIKEKQTIALKVLP